MAECKNMQNALIVISVYSGIATIVFLVVLVFIYKSKKVNQVPQTHLVQNSTAITKPKNDDRDSESTRQRNKISSNKSTLPGNARTVFSNTRHNETEDDINVIKVNRRFQRNLSEKSDISINDDQSNNTKPLSAVSQMQGTERYIEIIDNQSYTNQSTTSSSNSSEGTVYNDIVTTGQSRQNSVGSENTVYNDVIAMSRQASISSNNTLYNDVIEDVSPQDNSSTSSDDTIYNDCHSHYHHEETTSNDLIYNDLAKDIPSGEKIKTINTFKSNVLPPIKPSPDSNTISPNDIEDDRSSYVSDESLSNEQDHKDEKNSPGKCDVYTNNYASIVNEFQQYLQNVIKSDPKRYSNLLVNLPRFTNGTNRHVTCSSEGEESFPAFPMTSETSESFLLKFLRAGNNRFETATKILINYVLLMRDHPKYYSSSLKPDVIQKVYDEKIHTVLPVRDKFKRRVFIWRPGKWNPDTISFTDCYCAMYMLCEMMALEPMTQVEGCTVVCEGSNIGFRQLRSMCLEDIKNSANFIQETFPLWFRQVHVVNVSNLLRLAYNMIKPFVSDQVKESIIFHSDLSSFHNYIDKKTLPQELGGTNGPFDNSEMASAVYEMSEYFEQVQAYVNQNLNL